MDHLEGIPGGRGFGVGQHLHPSGRRRGQHRAFDGGVEAGFIRVGKQGSHLDPRGASCAGRLEPFGTSSAARNPEWQAERGNAGQIDLVPFAVERLTALVEPRLAAGRGIVPAGQGTLDHKPVDPSRRFAGQHRRERVAGDDGEKGRPVEGRRGVGPDAPRIEGDPIRVGRRPAGNLQLERGRLVERQLIERRRDLPRDTGAHQDHVDARQHRAVQQREVGQLHLGQEVHPDRPVVAFLGQEDLGERTQRRDQLPFEPGRVMVNREEPVGRIRLPSVRQEEPLDDGFGHAGNREPRQRAAKMAPDIAVLQPADEGRVERGAGNDTQLAMKGDGPGQLPPGDADPHAALNDRGECKG